MITLFARKEPTVDKDSVVRGEGGKKDTVIYRDKECTQLVARWPWYYSNCPRRNQRVVTINCYRWSLSWVN